MLTFLTSKIWHHAHSTVMSSYTNSSRTHVAYEDVLFHENDELQTEKIDKNKRWITFTSFLYVANCDSNASIGVTLGLLHPPPQWHNWNQEFWGSDKIFRSLHSKTQSIQWPKDYGLLEKWKMDILLLKLQFSNI